ncbi:MAG: arginyl-tRNA synthetase [Acidobacteria bacterium OLB17]|nr:MAG: arginyl-tRNA synthetase [Acidobacteria bacterium OLB17]
MTLLELRALLDEKVKAAAETHFSVKLANIAGEVPPKTELGDLAFPVAFELAKHIKQQTGEKANPREIAGVLSKALEGVQGVDRIEVAGAGYLNVFFDRAAFLTENAGREPVTPVPVSERAKVCIEHTSVNPNKAAHIGHVRNSVLGDTFARILTSNGKDVEIQNYIDNTGVQVADVVVGFLYLEGRDLASVKQLDAELTAAGKRFDHYCWDLYARVGQTFATDESLKEKRAEVLHALEEGSGPVAEFAEFVATRNVECILQTMERLSIYYDLLPRESEILHLHFWDKAFEKMKELGVVRFEDEGKHAGCWVMPFEEHSGTDEHEADKILVRSNGTVTYTGKDIAYQMWKLGILGLDFNYRPFRRDGGGEVWITTAGEGVTPHPAFGGGEKIYNVIDTRQSYPQEIVKKGVAAISPERGLSASVHLAYEMVALSPLPPRSLGSRFRTMTVNGLSSK